MVFQFLRIDAKPGRGLVACDKEWSIVAVSLHEHLFVLALFNERVPPGEKSCPGYYKGLG